MEKIKKFIPLIAGLALIGAAVFTYFRTGELVKNCTEKTTATVVDMHEEIDTSSEGLRYIYYPVVQYKAGDLTLEKRLSSGTNTPAYRINETLDILYNPANAEEFIVAGENQNLVWIFLGAFGLIFLAAGIYLLTKKQ